MTYLPVIRSVIDRRILVNFRVDPVVLQRLLPPPFEPKLVGGVSVTNRFFRVHMVWLLLLTIC